MTKLNPEIRKFWSAPGVTFFEMEVVPPSPLPKGEGYLNGYYHSLYCRSIAGRYTVIAKTKPYPLGEKPVDLKYEFYYLNDESNMRKYWTEYSEQEMLKIVRLKLFL